MWKCKIPYTCIPGCIAYTQHGVTLKTDNWRPDQDYDGTRDRGAGKREVPANTGWVQRYVTETGACVCMMFRLRMIYYWDQSSMNLRLLTRRDFICGTHWTSRRKVCPPLVFLASLICNDISCLAAFKTFIFSVWLDVDKKLVSVFPENKSVVESGLHRGAICRVWWIIRQWPAINL